MIGSMEPEIYLNLLRNLSENLKANFPSTTFCYSMVRIVCLDGAFLIMFELEVSPVEGQSLQQKD